MLNIGACREGVSRKLGLRTFGKSEGLVFLGKELHEERDYSEKIAEEIDQEIKALMVEAENRAKKLLKENKKKLIKIADRLLGDETIESEDLQKLLQEPQESI